MRKLNFLIGAASGLFGGILLSNKKLRNKLKKADDPGHAAKIFGDEMKRGGKEFAKEAKEWANSKEVQGFWKKMKRGAKKKCKSLQGEAGDIASRAMDKTKECLPGVSKKAKKVVGKAKKKVRKVWG